MRARAESLTELGAWPSAQLIVESALLLLAAVCDQTCKPPDIFYLSYGITPEACWHRDFLKCSCEIELFDDLLKLRRVQSRRLRHFHRLRWLCLRAETISRHLRLSGGKI